MQSIDKTAPTIEVLSKDYRISIPIPMPENLIEEQMKLFHKDSGATVKSPVKGCAIVKMAKVRTESADETTYAILFVLMKVQKLLINLGKSETDSFFITLKDAKGENADKCILTGTPNPYWFYYDGNRSLKVLEKCE
jgi:hypothetical protein